VLFRDNLVALLHGFLDSDLVFVGRVVRQVGKFLSVRKVCTFLAYSCLYMITVDLLLSARVIIAFSFVSLWLMFFSIYCCLLYVLWA
jgi:hypothetical protein